MEKLVILIDGARWLSVPDICKEFDLPYTYTYMVFKQSELPYRRYSKAILYEYDEALKVVEEFKKTYKPQPAHVLRPKINQ